MVSARWTVPTCDSRKRLDRRRPFVTVGREILVRKVALPRVGHVTAARGQIIAPRELDLIKTAARRVLPFGLGWQFLPGPGRIGFGIPARNVNNRMVVETADRTALAVGASPVGTELETPPVGEIAEIDGITK